MINFIKKMLDRAVQNIMYFEDNHMISDRYRIHTPPLKKKTKKKKTKKKRTKKKRTKTNKDYYGKWEGNL